MRIAIALGLFLVTGASTIYLGPLGVMIAGGIWALMVVSERWRNERVYLAVLIVPVVYVTALLGHWFAGDGGCGARVGSETARLVERDRWFPVPHTDCLATEPGQRTVEYPGDTTVFLFLFAFGLACAAAWMWLGPRLTRPPRAPASASTT
ncbi:MAG: hypothetical protein M3320_09225 [Actinomycetota bacterium]|nr:hypothetical protein [Actinomycetota bacterium]MDQ5808844.1 hypothetical protein [Actinomycetota bacterium]